MAYRLVTRANFAKLVGKSRQYITKAVDAGLVGIVGKGRVAKVNLDDALTVQFMQICKENSDVKQGKLTLDDPGVVPPIALNDTERTSITGFGYAFTFFSSNTSSYADWVSTSPPSSTPPMMEFV